ncbi:MAG: hypothetical protein DRN17_00435 [Thermoplasmata archaeon]|nr:MAG: hypothetical protein DRN17_00435 [Thermoplasmata archaeon]
MGSSYQITITSAGDIKQITDVINQIAVREEGKVKKKATRVLNKTAQTIAKSWRARVAAAPYSYNKKTARHGPHTRSGGVPLERAIRVVQMTPHSYAVKVYDIGGNAPDDSKPSAYANYDRNRYGMTRNGTPYSYKERAILTGMARLRSLLNNL